MKLSRLKIFAICCLGTLVCGVILLTGPEPLEASVPESKPLVTIGDLERKLVPTTITAFGSLTPRQSLELTTQVPGEIAWVHDELVPGGTLKPDDVLFQVDDRDYVIAVASAEAQYEQALATIDIERGRSEIAQLEWTAWGRESR